MPSPSLTAGFDLPFQEQIDFFRAKLNLPTEAWDDIWQAAHDRAFVVAGAMKADLLDDLRQAVDKAISTGTTLETFRKDFTEIVGRRGWQGWTGEGSPEGFAWRTKVIYETNLRSSYAAGRWAQLNDPDFKALMPFWRYVHNDSVANPRPQHKRWGDAKLTLPTDHPFWRTHFPPNGWGCRCRVTAVMAPKAGDATEPPQGWDVPNERGELPGIDKGWAYAPGASGWLPDAAKYPNRIKDDFLDSMRGGAAKSARARGYKDKAGGDMEISSIEDLQRFVASNESVFVRWSRGPELDSKMSGSRDGVSGEIHAGLSAVPLDPEMSKSELAKYVKEYGFLRMKDREISPYVFRGVRIGTDSDGYALIQPTEISEARRIGLELIKKLDAGLAKRLDLEEAIARDNRRLEKVTDAFGRKIIQESLEKNRRLLDELGS